jgi:DNA-directed RNA polymerase subunit RPC12/RpoP
VGMPRFRCTACGRRIESAVVIGAGDCPYCGGDVVFDLHGDAGAPEPGEPDKPADRPASKRRGRLRRLLGR